MKLFRFVKNEFWFLAAIAAAVFVFFPEMFFLKLSFLSGDHRAQHYPWAFYYAQQIKDFTFPWWTSLFQCGFPLAAEGQIGAFYLPNLIFYFLFPVFFAYTYNILFHYILGGFFFYGYLRTIRISNWPAFLGVVVYLFGTAQGGYYYNIISLKTLIWLPLSLYVVDQILLKKKYSWAAWLAVIFSFQLSAGYLQYAIYSIGFTAFYFLWFSRLRSNSFRQNALNLILLGFAFLGAVLVVLPQLGSTFELSSFSNRYGFPEEFAYVGSFNPFALSTLFFPHWDGFLRAEIYVGAVGMFFLIFSAATKKAGHEFFFWIMGAVALALALGKFNPLFVLLIKWTHFTSFRIPAKFIFFLAFALAVLCSYGFEKWLKQDGGESSKKPLRIYLGLSAFGITIGCAAGVFLKFFRQPIQGFLSQYIEKNFASSSVHVAPLESYLKRLIEYYDGVIAMVTFTDWWNLAFVFFMVLGAGVILSLNRQSSKKTWVKILVIGLVFLNLYVYGWTSIKGSYKGYDFIAPPSPVSDFLEQVKDEGRVHRFVSEISRSEIFPPIPHLNMLYGVSVAGGYSPLLMKNYYELMRGIGDVNDSNWLLTSDEAGWAAKKNFFDFLNIKNITADREFDERVFPFQKVFSDDGIHVYRNPNALPRAFFVSRADHADFEGFSALVNQGHFMPMQKVYLYPGDHPASQDADVPIMFYPADRITDRGNQVSISLQAPRSGYLVLSDIAYPGWRALVNGRETPILRANGIFRSVPIEKAGKFEVLFLYEPVWKKILPWSFGLFIVLLAVPVLVKRQRGILNNQESIRL